MLIYSRKSWRDLNSLNMIVLNKDLHNSNHLSLAKACKYHTKFSIQPKIQEKEERNIEERENKDIYRGSTTSEKSEIAIEFGEQQNTNKSDVKINEITCAPLDHNFIDKVSELIGSNSYSDKDIYFKMESNLDDFINQNKEVKESLQNNYKKMPDFIKINEIGRKNIFIENKKYYLDPINY